MKRLVKLLPLSWPRTTPLSAPRISKRSTCLLRRLLQLISPTYPLPSSTTITTTIIKSELALK